jgi:hypothetical protein
MSNVNLTLFFQIANLRSNAKKYIEELGSIDDSQLPPFIKSVRNLVEKVQTLLNNVKSDIMLFYNVSFSSVILYVIQLSDRVYNVTFPA